MIIKNLKEFYLSCYNEVCKKGITRNVLYRNRLYKGAFYLGKCYILSSKDELLNITDKKYKVIS